MALSTQRASASFLSNESTPPWEYDVFLSFRGVDTRRGFVSHLYGELCKWQGIRTFFDDRELEGGSSIGRELPSAIEKSHTAIVVLSPKYASSKWCLKELTTILQCMEARDSVLPVFYETDPSDVGNQQGCFAEAFAELERNLISIEDKEKVVQWKADLKRVSKITGKHWKNFKCDRELVEDIVKWVWMKVQATFTLSDSSRKLVGIDYAFEQLSLLLAHDPNDVRFIGITGMGGIGKTTLAKLVYDKICRHFEVHCFLANVREVCAKKGIVDLAKKLLFPFLRERIVEIWDEERVSILIEKFLHNKKVLLVLDDVDELKQLEVFAGNQGWFGMGSRITVTTRNQRLLVQHGIETSYKVQGLNDAEAFKLFSLHAFKKDQPKEDFLELSKYFINYARGLPLALIIFGSALFKRGLDAWISERDSLSKIFDKLKISYDRLEEREKSIFLDVACLHKGKHTEKVIEMLYNSNPFGMSSRIVIDGLIERFLPIICYVAAQPIIDPIWRGSLSIFNKDFNIVSGLVAHLSSLACPKVREEAELLPLLLFPELVNRTDVWPKAFGKCGPNDQSIALYFFPDNERDEKDFDTLVVSMIQDDLAMRAVLEDAEVLVFTSIILPEQYRRFQTKFYLWGVFTLVEKHVCATEQILLRKVCLRDRKHKTSRKRPLRDEGWRRTKQLCATETLRDED